MQISLSTVDKIITHQQLSAASTISKVRVIFSSFDFELPPLTCFSFLTFFFNWSIGLSVVENPPANAENSGSIPG